MKKLIHLWAVFAFLGLIICFLACLPVGFLCNIKLHEIAYFAEYNPQTLLVSKLVPLLTIKTTCIVLVVNLCTTVDDDQTDDLQQSTFGIRYHLKGQYRDENSVLIFDTFHGHWLYDALVFDLTVENVVSWFYGSEIIIIYTWGICFFAKLEQS